VRGWRIAGYAAGGVAAFVLAMLSVPPPRGGFTRVLVVGLGAYGCLLARLAFGFGSRPEAAVARRAVVGDPSAADEQDVRLARLDATLVRASESAEQWARATRPMLRRLATERLRASAGIDVTADPAGARRLMGEELWEIFATTTAGDAGPPPDPERLRRLVAAVERL
jgi:threonine dehydrogenase-like Zn-dependent dehydrogenase